MTTLLNLDELAPAQRTITLGGQSHEVRSMTVEDFIRRQREAKTVDATDDPAEQVDRAVKMVNETVPSIGEAKLRSLTMDQLTALINFIVNPPDTAPAPSAPAAEGEEAGK